MQVESPAYITDRITAVSEMLPAGHYTLVSGWSASPLPYCRGHFSFFLQIWMKYCLLSNRSPVMALACDDILLHMFSFCPANPSGWEIVRRQSTPLEEWACSHREDGMICEIGKGDVLGTVFDHVLASLVEQVRGP